MAKSRVPSRGPIHNRAGSTAIQPGLAHRSKDSCLPAPPGYSPKGVRPAFMDPGHTVGPGAITQHQAYARSGTPKAAK
jgi:hypothetical protein